MLVFILGVVWFVCCDVSHRNGFIFLDIAHILRFAKNAMYKLGKSATS